MSTVGDIARDLALEQRALDDLVAPCERGDWARATPASGWDVADQINHLTYFDAAAAQAITDPAAFALAREELVRAALSRGVDEYTIAAMRGAEPDEILSAWRDARERLAAAAGYLDTERRVPWYGPDMKARSFLTARLMETWAHGVDVADALGAPLSASARLAHVARLGLNTREWSYRVRGEEVPAARVSLILEGPDGHLWRLGPEDADEVIEGPALDFCLVVTQRRHPDDTALKAGAWGRHWLLRAQAFAGAPTTGPAPRSS